MSRRPNPSTGARASNTIPPAAISASATAGLRDCATRRRLVIAFFTALGVVLACRAVYLQVFDHAFYRGQGDARQLRTVSVPATRGLLLDRDGEPLAISTPIDTLWAEPKKLVKQPAAIGELAAILELDADQLAERVRRVAARKPAREFMYIKRHVEPTQIDQALALGVEGLSKLREYRRYYPNGSAGAHVLGFTDIDERGREGLELAYDSWLAGRPGSRRVQRDLIGREITGRTLIDEALPGKDLRLSIDKQLQYFADRALVDAVRKNRAESASVVVMKVSTGEILAMANAPSYNPNDRRDRGSGRQRNRVVTDVFEPGSTMKPFTIAAALESGRFTPDDIVHTSPGYYTIGKYSIHDTKDNGWLDLRGIIRQSSNVGVSKVARQLEPEQMWAVFDRFGFGRPPGTEFPGEVPGYFNHASLWHRVEQASVSYGYGLSVSALQLARAYAALAGGGVMPPVSFLAVDKPVRGERIVDRGIALELQSMLEAVVTEGTGHRAGVPGYRVAGKTGTSRLSADGGYREDRYVSLFAGFAPVSRPEYVAVVVVQDPTGGEYFGSTVAAPVFADVMAQALRLGGVEPDDTKVMRGAIRLATPGVPEAAPVVSRRPGERS